MDKLTRRAATIAANKLLAAAGYNPRGLSLQAAERKRRAIKAVNKSETIRRQKAAGKRKRGKK